MNKINKQIIVLTGFIERNNKILLVLRDEPECKGAHMKWELPGGRIDFGEIPAECIRREIKEETGLSVKVECLVPVIQSNIWDYKDVNQHTLVLCFKCKVKNGELNDSDHHVKDIKWFKYKEIIWSQTLIGTKELIDTTLKCK